MAYPECRGRSVIKILIVTLAVIFNSRITASTESLLRSGLTDLLLELLAGVANALVLVWIGLTERTHIGCDLTDLLPVDAGYGEVGLLGIDSNFDTGGQRELDGVRVAKGEDDHALALQLGAVSDAD